MQMPQYQVDSRGAMMTNGLGERGGSESNFETAVGKGLMTNKERENNAPRSRAHERLTVSWRNQDPDEATSRHWVAYIRHIQ
jgi:hypothetical protein